MYFIISSARPSRISERTFGVGHRTVPCALNSSFPFWSIISAQDEKRGTTKGLGQGQDRVSGDDKTMVSLLEWESESLGSCDEELALEGVPGIVQQASSVSGADLVVSQSMYTTFKVPLSSSSDVDKRFMN